MLLHTVVASLGAQEKVHVPQLVMQGITVRPLPVSPPLTVSSTHLQSHKTPTFLSHPLTRSASRPHQARECAGKQDRPSGLMGSGLCMLLFSAIICPSWVQ